MHMFCCAKRDKKRQFVVIEIQIIFKDNVIRF